MFCAKTSKECIFLLIVLQIPSHEHVNRIGIWSFSIMQQSHVALSLRIKVTLELDIKILALI